MRLIYIVPSKENQDPRRNIHLTDARYGLQFVYQYFECPSVL
jgi:hypothetical protein